jgi:DNA-binding FadR family transcriptional regulator
MLSLLKHNHQTVPRRQKTAALLAQRIVADINQRHLQPGTMLPPERDMLAQYRVGRFTLREALRYLELQGLITVRPGPGGGPAVSVPEPKFLAVSLALGLQYTQTRFRATLETRLAIEPAVAARAAEGIDPALLAEIADSVEVMGRSLDDVHVFLEQNSRFHDLLAWSSGNSIFGYLLSALHWIADGTSMGVSYPLWGRKVVYNMHRRICDAISAHEPELAAEAMREHLQQYVVYMERYYPEVMDQIIRWESVPV